MYTDDILAISEKPRDILNTLDQHYVLQPSLRNTWALGAQIKEWRILEDPEKVIWAMSSEKYVKEAIRNVVNWLEEHNLPKLKPRAPSVFPSNYRPELDLSAYCDDEFGHYYQLQIGVLRWAVELGSINICTEVSMLAVLTTAPRILGHFHAMLHVFSFLSHHPRCHLVFDAKYVNFDDGPDRDWYDFYPGEVEMIAFVDSDHAGDLLTRRSR